MYGHGEDSHQVDRPVIHHVLVAMPSGEEAAARHFYRDLIGLEELEKPANLRKLGGVWFCAGELLQLHLGVDRAFRPAEKPHVAFRVGDLEGVRKRLLEAGFDTWEDEPLPRYRRFYTRDPFGNRVEVLEPL